MSYWVVFNNDMALAVCTSQAQADAEVNVRKKEYRAEMDKEHAGRAPWHLTSALHRCYFHWHEVPASKII